MRVETSKCELRNFFYSEFLSTLKNDSKNYCQIKNKDLKIA